MTWGENFGGGGGSIFPLDPRVTMAGKRKKEREGKRKQKDFLRVEVRGSEKRKVYDGSSSVITILVVKMKKKKMKTKEKLERKWNTKKKIR